MQGVPSAPTQFKLGVKFLEDELRRAIDIYSRIVTSGGINFYPEPENPRKPPKTPDPFCHNKGEK